MSKPASRRSRCFNTALACILATSLAPALPRTAALADEAASENVEAPSPAAEASDAPSEGETQATEVSEAAPTHSAQPESATAEPAVPLASPTSAASQNEEAGWQACGSCEWLIDEQGCLIIRPADYASVGTIELPGNGSRWDGLDDSITSARFEGTCKVGPDFDVSLLFSGLRNLTSVNLYGLDVSDATSLAGMFAGCSSLTSVSYLGHLETSSIVDMSGMFKSCTSLQSISLGALNTSHVRDMSSLFEGCSSLTSVSLWGSSGDGDSGDIPVAPGGSNGRGTVNTTIAPYPNGFTTENAANLSSMFAGCSALTELDLRSLITSSATAMDSLFSGCDNLHTIMVGSAFSLAGATGSNLASFPTPSEPGALGTWLSTGDGQTYASDDIPGNIAATYTAQFKTPAGKIALRPEMFDVNCTDAEYTGQAIYQSSYSSILRENTDFTVECYDTVNVGRSVVIMTGIGSYAGQIAFSFDIVKADPKLPAVPLLVAKQGQTLADLSLPQGYSWQDDESAAMMEPGLRRALVTYTPSDTRNCNIVRDIPVKIGVMQDDPQAADGWQLCGTCEWQIDAAGCLTIRPANGAATGFLDAWQTAAPWSSLAREIASVRFEGRCFAPTLKNMFKGCGFLSSVDFSGLDSSMADDASSMFANCIKLRTLDVSALSTANMANIAGMFRGCTNLDSVVLPTFASPISDASSLFLDCSVLKTCVVPSLQMASGSSLQGMFKGCSNLQTLDVMGISTKGVTDMGSLFESCSNLEALDVSGFDTSSATTMSRAFEGCKKLRTLDVSSFDTSNVEDLSYLFSSCEALESIDVSGFDTSQARKMDGVFSYCSSLTSLDLASFDTTSVDKPAPPARDGWPGGNAASAGSSSSVGPTFFTGCNKLTTIALGAKFAFSSLYGNAKREFPFPTPTGPCYTGRWVNSVGEVFSADTIPDFTADVYTAEVAGADIPGKPGQNPQTSVQRLAGDDAAATSAAIAQAAFPEGSEWVVIARDDDFADAMSATGLAGALNAPILLTDRNGLSGATAGAVKALGAKRAYVIGGNGAIPADLESQLAEVGCEVIDRVFGNDSWDTSVACAQKIADFGGNPNDDAIVAMSSNFQDALSISSFAYKYRVPIFLETDADNGRVLPESAREAIGGLSGTIYVPGGPGAVPTSSVEDVFGSSRVQRIYGEDGYDTSNQIATYMVSHGLLSASTVCVASGAPAPKGVDALAGAALAGRAGGVMLLANDNPKFGDVDFTTVEGADSQKAPAFLASHAGDVQTAYLLGGQAVVGTELTQKVNGLLS